MSTESFKLPLNLDTYDYLGQMSDSRVLFADLGATPVSVVAVDEDGDGYSLDLDAFAQESLAQHRRGSFSTVSDDDVLYIATQHEGQKNSKLTRITLDTGVSWQVSFDSWSNTLDESKMARELSADGSGFSDHSGGKITDVPVVDDASASYPYSTYLLDDSGPGAQLVRKGQPNINVDSVPVAWAGTAEDALIVSGPDGVGIYDASTGAQRSVVDTGTFNVCSISTQIGTKAVLLDCEQAGTPGNHRYWVTSLA